MASKASIIQSLELSQNYTDVLLVLCSKDSTAAEILSKTTVSNGRIYRLLSELEIMGLITKNLPTSRGQAIYTISPFANHIQNYLQKSFATQSQRISTIVNSLDSLDHPDTVSVFHGTKADFDHHIESFLYQSSWIKILHKHTSLPWFLYCFDEEVFFKVREVISHTRHTGSSSLKAELLLKRQAYLDSYATKSVAHIMSLKALTNYLQILKKLRLRPDLNQLIKQHPQVKINVIDKLHNPFSTYISTHQVIQPLFFPTKTDRLLIFQGKELSDTYQDYFAKYLEDSVPITSII